MAEEKVTGCCHVMTPKVPPWNFHMTLAQTFMSKSNNVSKLDIYDRVNTILPQTGSQ